MTALALFLLLTPASQAQWTPNALGYCYADAGCQGGLLGYRPLENCAAVYGRSWLDDQTRTCHAIGSYQGPEIPYRYRYHGGMP